MMMTSEGYLMAVGLLIALVASLVCLSKQRLGSIIARNEAERAMAKACEANTRAAVAQSIANSAANRVDLSHRTRPRKVQ